MLWKAVERFIPDIRERAVVSSVGTPLTHERFLRRYRGTYGPELQAGKRDFPGATTQIDGLFCCGDSAWPGIGVPAVAGSGIAAAHAIVGVDESVDESESESGCESQSERTWRAVSGSFAWVVSIAPGVCLLRPRFVESRGPIRVRNQIHPRWLLRLHRVEVC